MLGRAFGARVVLHPSAVILVALVAFLLASGDRGETAGTALARGVLLAGVLVGSVFVHELAHALAARLFHREVKEIVLSLIGGHTAFDAKDLTPLVSGVTAFAGPLGSGLIGLAAVAFLGLDPSPGPYQIVWAVAAVNIVLAVFNILPGAPLDGGRVLEAIVWGVTGKRTTGMKASAWGGRVVALANLGYVAFIIARSGGEFDLVYLVWAVLVFSLLWPAAGATLRAARIVEKVEGLSVAQVMRGAIGVPHHTSLRDALGLCQAAECEEVVVLSAASEPAGRFTLASAEAVPSERLDATGLSAVTILMPRGATIAATATGFDLIRAVRDWWGKSDVLAVLDGGEIVGVVRLAEVGERLGQGGTPA